MKALISPVEEAGIVSEIKNSARPLQLWGMTDSARPLIAEATRGKNPFLLMVTYDEARAEKLYQKSQDRTDSTRCAGARGAERSKKQREESARKAYEDMTGTRQAPAAVPAGK